MKKIKSVLLFLFCFSAITAQNNIQSTVKSSADPLYNIEEILDEKTLDVKILQDWHVDKTTSSTRQKLIEITVAEWWSGKYYRIPVRLIVPLKGKAKGFHITGDNSMESLKKDSKPNDFEAKLLANGVGVVKTVVLALKFTTGNQELQKEMEQLFREDLNLRYTTQWIWAMTLMRATTAAYAETNYFEKGKVAGSGGSKNGVSPARALINDERFTATCSSVAFAYYSPTRSFDEKKIKQVEAANKIFFESVKAGKTKLNDPLNEKWLKAKADRMTGFHKAALKWGKSLEEINSFRDGMFRDATISENWDQLKARRVDMLFQPGTHDFLAYDLLWGAKNYSQLPVYYKPNGGHDQTPHHASAKDNQNLQAFLWNHFFGGEPLMKPPTIESKIDNDKLSVTVRFTEGPQAKSGRIWWIYDRAPEGSAPFLHKRIPEDQWMDMEFDKKTGTWTATIPLKNGFERIDFFSNHGLKVNGYKQYISCPYTRVERSPSKHN